MKGKYNNGKPIEIPENNEEKSLAIREWSENNENLENAITSCIDNNISTHASCAGHTLFDLPYLSLIVNKNDLGRILNIMNSLQDINNTRIGLSYLEEQGSILTITTDMLHKNAVFDKIAEAAKEEISIQDASPLVQEIYNMHKDLRTHRQGHEIDMKKSRLSRTMYIRSYTQTFNRDILDKLKIKRVKHPYELLYRKRFSNISKLNHFASTIIAMVDGTFQESTDDDLFGQEKEVERSELKSRVKFDIEPVSLKKLEPDNQKAEKIQEVE